MNLKILYQKQKASAKHRGIEFKLTFEEWLQFWGNDLEKRGRGLHDLVMSRKGDKGAYEIGNIEKKTWYQNKLEQKKPNLSLRERLGENFYKYCKDNQHLGPVALARKFNVNKDAISRMLGTQKKYWKKRKGPEGPFL